MVPNSSLPKRKARPLRSRLKVLGPYMNLLPPSRLPEIIYCVQDLHHTIYLPSSSTVQTDHLCVSAKARSVFNRTNMLESLECNTSQHGMQHRSSNNQPAAHLPSSLLPQCHRQSGTSFTSTTPQTDAALQLSSSAIFTHKSKQEPDMFSSSKCSAQYLLSWCYLDYPVCCSSLSLLPASMTKSDSVSTESASRLIKGISNNVKNIDFGTTTWYDARGACHASQTRSASHKALGTV